MSKRVQLLLFILFPLIVVGVLLAAFHNSGFTPPGPLVQEEHFQDYDVKVYFRYDQNLFERICGRLPSRISDFCYRVHGQSEYSGFEIIQNGHRVFSAYGTGVDIAQFNSNNVAGIDITGDGIPNVVISDRCGRNGGGSFFVFECGNKIRQIATVDSWEKYPELRDFNGDGIPEVVAEDNEFYHFPNGRDGDPMPQVILRWENGKYIAAADLMAKPAPSPEELEAKAAAIQVAIKSQSPWEGYSELSVTAIELMYSGNEKSGWKLIEMCLPPSTDRDYFITNVGWKLPDSEYWRQIKTKNSTNTVHKTQSSSKASVP